MDTGVFDENRYFDVFVEYAKASPEDILVRIQVANRGPEAAELHLLPTVWFRNTWSWGTARYRGPNCTPTSRQRHRAGRAAVRQALAVAPSGAPELLFTENETNTRRLFGIERRAVT